MLCIVVMLLCCFAGKSQVIAGIRANGKIYLHGDTINVCRGSTITYQSVAQGSLNISWKFNNASKDTAEGIGPFIVTYNNNGYDTTFQKVVGGLFADSMFIIVYVSSVKPIANFNFSKDNVCGHENIQFTNLSSAGSYEWTFNDGTESEEKSPSHQFLSAIGLPGIQTFDVGLITTNINNCKDSATKTVTIKKVPDAAIGNADNSVQFAPFNGMNTFKKCSNIPSYNFKFLNQSTTLSNNVSYKIQWGDGKPDSIFAQWDAATIISHTFPLGSSTMTVNVTGADGCIGIKKYTVFIGTTPAGGLASLGNTDICSSDSLRFAITNAENNPPGTAYTFYINDGADIQKFKHAPPPIVGHFFKNGSCSFSSNNGLQTYFNAFGAYLTIENPCGSNSASVVPIYVSGKPRPSINIPSPVVCINSTVTVTNASNYGNVVTATGTFSSVCENKGRKVWAITPSTGYTIVSGKTGSLNGNTTNGLLWTDGTNSLDLRFTAAGMYQVKIYIYNERCGMDSSTETICVRTPPAASFTMSKQRSCSPTTIDLTNTSPAGGCLGEEYKWEVVYDDPTNCAPAGGGPAWKFAKETTSLTKSPSITVNTIGRYIIKLTVHAKNSFGCDDAIVSDTFYLSGPPKVAVESIKPVCINNTITPKALATGCYSIGSIGYKWNFANGSPTSSTSLLPGNIFYATTGVHPIQLIVMDSSCMLSDTINTSVTIVPLPAVEAGRDTTICSGITLSLGDTGTAGVTYQWSPATGLSDTKISNPIATLQYNGIANDTVYKYYVHASVGTNCTNIDSVEIRVKKTPFVSVSPQAARICIGTSTVLTASGVDNYTWKPAEGLNNINNNVVTAAPVVTTEYSVTGFLFNGCFDEKKAVVTIVPDAKAEFLAPDTIKCSPLKINNLITVVPFPEGNGTYNWYADNVLIGSNTTGDVPDYTITVPGKAVVIKLVTLSAEGCKSDEMEKTFMALPSVTAAFTKDKKSSCAPLTVSFINTSTNFTDINFIWEFGNGKSSTEVHPGPVTYDASPFFRDTMYYIVLKATNGCDTSYYKDTVTVLANVKARFAVDTARGCSPFTISISNNSQGNGSSYYWDFGDGKTDTTHSLWKFTHTYYTGTITTYTIRLIAENNCQRDTQLINIVVSPNQIKPFITAYGNQLKGCAPHTVIFNNSTVGASQLTWNFGDNTAPVIISNDQGSISHQYAKAGIYKISIRLKNDCSDTTIERQVEVYDPPVAAFNVAPQQICEGQSVVVTNQSTNANSFEWVWGDGSTSAFSAGQHQYNYKGVYDIRLVAQRVHTSGFVCTDTITKQISVVSKVAAQINVAPGKACAPYTLKANAVNTTGAALIEWVLYDSSSTTQKEFHTQGSFASHVYNTGGSYSARLVVHTTAGCTDTAFYNFEVFNTPHAIFDQRQISTCEHDTVVKFNASITHAGNDQISYKWFINDNIEGTDNSLDFRFRTALSNPQAEQFTIKALAQNSAGCGDTSGVSKLVIQPLPVPSVSVGPAIVLQQPDYEFTFKDLAATSPDKHYTWDMGDRSLQTRNGQQITYQYGDTGTYNVKLLVRNLSTGCMATDSVKVSILYIPGYLQVPNAMCPGCSNYSLRSFLPLGKGLKKYRLSIYTTWGQKIFETTSLNADGSPNVAWDGTFNGKPLQQDVYSWQIEATYKNETEWKGMIYPGSNKPVKAGFITIIK